MGVGESLRTEELVGAGCLLCWESMRRAGAQRVREGGREGKTCLLARLLLCSWLVFFLLALALLCFSLRCAVFFGLRNERTHSRRLVTRKQLISRSLHLRRRRSPLRFASTFLRADPHIPAKPSSSSSLSWYRVSYLSVCLSVPTSRRLRASPQSNDDDDALFYLIIILIIIIAATRPPQSTQAPHQICCSRPWTI